MFVNWFYYIVKKGDGLEIKNKSFWLLLERFNDF